MPAAPVSSICGRSIGEAGIDHQRDRLAVLGDAGPVAQRAVLRLPPRAQLHPLAIGGFDVGRRAHMHCAGRAVDDDGVARLDEAGGVVDLADRRDAERARDDRDMRGRPAFLQHQAAQPFAVVVEQRRRAHRARDQDGVFRQLLARRRVILARSARASAGWRDRRGRAAARADRGRRRAACARGCRTARVRRRLRRSGRSSPPRASCAASPGRRRTCGRPRARRGARRRRRRRGARPSGRGRRAAWRWRHRAASTRSARRRR